MTDDELRQGVDRVRDELAAVEPLILAMRAVAESAVSFVILDPDYRGSDGWSAALERLRATASTYTREQIALAAAYAAKEPQL